MSFRKRGEIVGQSARAPTRLGNMGAARQAGPHIPLAKPKNPTVRPSTITSQPSISTGISDLDKILLHLGIPVGSLLLVEESGTTDFSSVVVRTFASQGIVHSRLDKDTAHSHVIALGVPPQWALDLPGVYKGSTKDQKRAQVTANETKVSVSNLSESTTRRNDLKIAWRYGINKEKSPLGEETDNEIFAGQFDLTLKITPSPNPHEVSSVQISEVNSTIKQIHAVVESQIKKNPSMVVRLVIPGLLHPSIYPPTWSTPVVIIPFVHSLRSLVRQYLQNLVIVASLALDLYPRDTNLVFQLEQMADAAIHLQPFNQEMTALIEKAYKSEPGKVQHGLVNVIKIPTLSDRGMMLIHDGEYAFKNGRKKFEIEPWGIPVEEEEEQQPTKENIEF